MMAALVCAPVAAFAGSADKDVKSYLVETLGRIETAADGFVRDAAAYNALVSVNGGDQPKVSYSPVTITRYEPQERTY